jgi:5-methylcytosine-specific restriction endonuclease McrA
VKTLPKQLNMLVWMDYFDQEVQNQVTENLNRDDNRISYPTMKMRASELAWKKTIYHDIPKWHRLREIIWKRDGGVCFACGRYAHEYHLGHLVDRVCGGMDIPENLVVMCASCNMLKPVHETTEDAIRWCKETKGVLGACEDLLYEFISSGENGRIRGTKSNAPAALERPEADTGRMSSDALLSYHQPL